MIKLGNTEGNNNELDLNKIDPKNNKSIIIIYNDYELNTMDYKDALSNDKRTCCEYYFALNKSKNEVLFFFSPRKDYNSLIIKSCIFSLSFSAFYLINFAFFNDEILNQIYEQGENIMLYISCQKF